VSEFKEMMIEIKDFLASYADKLPIPVGWVVLIILCVILIVYAVPKLRRSK
jgi:hypothetical protein